ncbi:MAG: radical SAM protein [Acidobacteria bacterium]|nr:radical SAM protein [Acidobacteriota bacterium]
MTPPRLRREIEERRTYLESPPDTVNIEFTGKCHMHPPCTYCVGKNGKDYQEPGHISDEQLEQYWPYMLQAQRVNDCTYGEFQLYPRHEEVVARLTANGVRFGFTTIGHLLNERRARFLLENAESLDFVVSINAATEETYRKYQGSGFDLTVRNLRRLVELNAELRPGKRPPFALSFIVMRGNRHEAIPFLRLARGLGVERVIFRHLFDMRVGDYAVRSFGHEFRYESERLDYKDYMALRAEVESSGEFGGMLIHFEWKAPESFIQEQAEPGVDIPCLFPWKYLCIRPVHDSYTPCCFMKKPIAKPSEASVAEVWNGEVMVGMRTELAAGKIPHHCRTHGDACPLVLESHRPQMLVQIK